MLPIFFAIRQLAESLENRNPAIRSMGGAALCRLIPTLDRGRDPDFDNVYLSS